MLYEVITFLVPVDPQEKILLVVPQEDVERRPVLLDHRVFEEKSLFLGGGHDATDGGCPTQQMGNLGAAVTASHRVLVEAGTQIFRLPDVEDLPPGVRHQVDPRSTRECLPSGEGIV